MYSAPLPWHSRIYRNHLIFILNPQILLIYISSFCDFWAATFIFLANFSYFLPYMSQVVQYSLLNVDCTVLLFRKCECISTMKIIWNSKLYRDNKYYICIWVIWWFSNAHFEKLLRDSIQNRFKSLRYTTQTSISFSFSNWKIEELK